MSGSLARRSVGLVMAVLVGALSTAVNASAAGETITLGGGAFGIGASPAVVEPFPAVTLPPGGGGPFTETTGPYSAVVVADEGLRVETGGYIGTADPGSGRAASSARANGVTSLMPFPAPRVTATEIRSECWARHHAPLGRSESWAAATLSHAQVNTLHLPVSPDPNTVIDVAPGVQLHLNEQIRRNVPGEEISITVNALRMSIDIPLVARAEVIVGQSRCAVFGTGVLVPPSA